MNNHSCYQVASGQMSIKANSVLNHAPEKYLFLPARDLRHFLTQFSSILIQT
uniref:Uncharacterized protein n=1 Tax=Rhizophora mucronata TaxID=61149 RepID=A0A2P2J7L2_RHIMU